MTAAADGEQATTESQSLQVQVVHASPGRIRVKVPKSAVGSAALRDAEQALSAQPGVRQVRVNPAAASVVVDYDPEAVSLPALFAAIARAGVTIEPVDARKEGSRSTDGLYLGKPVEKVAGAANQQVAKLTGGAADLRVLVPVGLGALALREILSGRLGAAPWYTLLWWTFDSFLKLRRPDVSRELTE
jgi:copper chaperone CopZ